MDGDPQQRLCAIGDVLAGSDERAYLGEPAGTLELAGASGDGQPAQRGAHLVHPEEVDRVAVLAALHHGRERHHLRRPIGGARHVHALRAPERLRAEVGPARQHVVDDRDGAEPEAEAVGAQLHLRRCRRRRRAATVPGPWLQEPGAGQAGVQRDAGVAVVRGHLPVGVGDRHAVPGRAEADGAREGDLPVVDVAQQTGDGPRRRARPAQDVVHVELQRRVRPDRAHYAAASATASWLRVCGGHRGAGRCRGRYLRMDGGGVERDDEKNGERGGRKWEEARHLGFWLVGRAGFCCSIDQLCIFFFVFLGKLNDWRENGFIYASQGMNE
jgi:hypothetical protein